jgi:hypothetical protein
LLFIYWLNRLEKREMSNKEILAIYKIAEKHWSRPAWLCWILGWNETECGLCWYFGKKHNLHYYNIDSSDAPWVKYKTKTRLFGLYHFHTRKERLQAIRKVIKDLENEQ